MPFKAADPRSEKINSLVRLKARGGRQHSSGSIFNKNLCAFSSTCLSLEEQQCFYLRFAVHVCFGSRLDSLRFNEPSLSPMQWDKYFIAMHLLNMELNFKGITCRKREGLYHTSVFTKRNVFCLR